MIAIKSLDPFFIYTDLISIKKKEYFLRNKAHLTKFLRHWNYLIIRKTICNQNVIVITKQFKTLM